MDSDSSLDEKFETRGEVAASNDGTRSNTPSIQGGNSQSESSSEEEEEVRQEPPQQEPGEEAKSPAGEAGAPEGEEEEDDDDDDDDDDEDDDDSESSSYSSSSSAQGTTAAAVGDKDVRPSDEAAAASRGEEEEEESPGAPPPADLSDVSDMDSRDSLEAVFAQDRKVKPCSRVSEEEQGQGESDAAKGGESEGGVEATKEVEEEEGELEAGTGVVDTEQLDFEAEEEQPLQEVRASLEDKEEGECCEAGVGRSGEEEKEKSEEGEVEEGEDLEEGELTDEDEARPGEAEPRPVCRFYNRGQCTWGSSCRFVHPGVTDKGNYTMFELPRALLPVNGPPAYSPDYRVPYEKPFTPVASFPRKEEVAPVFESAWERGLRHAKEMMRKATKRKEMDIDFEEKKMNLSLGQEELDKENDYYTRPASPVACHAKEDAPWAAPYEDGGAVDMYHGMVGGGHGMEHVRHHPAGLPAQGGDYWRRVHYEGMDTRSLRVEAEYVGRDRKERPREGRDLPPQRHQHHSLAPGEPLAPPRGEHHHPRHGEGGTVARGVEGRGSSSSGRHGTKKHHSSTRTGANAVPLQQMPPIDKSAAWPGPRDDKLAGISPSGVPQSQKARGDEWADPWMRSKSPTARRAAVTGSGSASGGGAGVTAAAPSLRRSSRRHHRSFSSGSSYSSSSSSSRSSSRSSYSSFSSRSRSPRPPIAQAPGARQQRHPHRHPAPLADPAANHQAPPGRHHRPTASSPVTGQQPPQLSSGGQAKSRSRSPLSRAPHRPRAPVQPPQQPPSGGMVGSRVMPPASPVGPPGRKVGRSGMTVSPGSSLAAQEPPRKMMGGYNVAAPSAAAAAAAAAMMHASMRGQGLVQEPSPQLVRKALHAIPAPQPRIMATTRAPQAAVAVAAAAAKSATESRHHRRRHDARAARRHRSSTSRRSRSSSSHSDDDLSDDDNSGTGSSTDSSDSSGSSSSSTSSSSSSSSDEASGEAVKKATSPQVRPKRFMIDDRAALANSMKVKAMDALKLSGQKQQIKLTLKAPGSNLAAGKRPVLDMADPLAMRNRDRPMNFPMMPAAKKRPAAPDSPSSSPTDTSTQPPPSKLVAAGAAVPKAKKAASRREELLKQLKAVEDAIARKRSKITFPGTS